MENFMSPILEFGKYKGKQIGVVPNGYQYWLLKNCELFLKEKYPDVLKYLKENEEFLEESYRASIPDFFNLIDFD